MGIVEGIHHCAKLRIRTQLLILAVVVLQAFYSLTVCAQSPSPAPAAPPSLNSRELYALYSLRSSLGLRSRDWPIKANPCTNWTGISCDGIGRHVAGINISGLRRTRKGKENPQFSADGLRNLSFLTSFTASGFLLPGTIPTWLNELQLLADIDLSSCGIVGTIPFSLPSSLLNLDLSGNFLQGSIPESLLSLGNLRALRLFNNKLNGSISFPSFRQLLVLDISNNSFSGNLSLELSKWNGSVSGSVMNLSQNLFYGAISSELVDILHGNGVSYDISGNYLEGKVPNELVPNSSSSLSGNCLQDLPKQRTFDDCSQFYDEMGLLFVGFGNPSPSPLPSPSSNDNKTTASTVNWRLIVSIMGGVLGLLLIPTVIFFVLRCRQRRKTRGGEEIAAGQGGERQRTVSGADANANAVPGKTASALPAGISLNLSRVGKAYTYEQILHATQDFDSSNFIKQGHSGDIYRGSLEGGIPVVVKRIELSRVKRDEYMVELDFFSRTSNHRFVPLLGHCLEKETEKILVYKYMLNGDLSNALFRKNASSEEGTLQSLDWITRLKIATGTAEALFHLHHEFTPPRVHRDVQASSILLDDKFEVRLGSLSEVSIQEGDSHPSVKSRLFRFHRSAEGSRTGSATLTCAYDVYCFGKVLLELVTGKLGLSGRDDDSSTSDWLEWAMPYISIHDKELLSNIVDPSLVVHDDLMEEVWAMAIVAKSCLNPRPPRRPPIRHILKALENPLKVVREENYNGNSSQRLRATSSRGSWNGAYFGSWRRNSVEMAAPVPGLYREGNTSMKLAGSTGSPGRGQAGDTSSNRRLSKEIFPEPAPASLDISNERLD